MWYWIVGGYWLGGVLLGGWAATQKGRGWIEGASLAALFGPLGVLVECGLPVVARDADAARLAPTAEDRPDLSRIAAAPTGPRKPAPPDAISRIQL